MKTRVKKNNVELEIEFDYQPYEPATREYPGCPEEVMITSVFYKGTDITDFIWEFVDMGEIEALVLESRNNQ